MDTLDSSLGGLPEAGRSLQLLAEARGGDATAMGELLQRYEARVRRIVSIRTGASLRRLVGLDDVVQEVFLRALRSLHEFEPRDDAGIIDWMASVAQHVIVDEARRWRAQKRDPERVRSMDASSEMGPLAGSVRTPSSLAHRSEAVRLVDEALESLEPPEYREAILLRDYHDGDWEFVRARLGKDTVKAAQQMHRRARLRLASKLQGKLGS